MENQDNWTERRTQYMNAKRVINHPTFPTKGFYFIRTIIDKEFPNGDIFPVAVVNWKPYREDGYLDQEEGNKFYLRLDYLFGQFCKHPPIFISKLQYRFIEVTDVYLTNWTKNGNKHSDIIVNWQIREKLDMLDHLTYGNVFSLGLILEAEAREIMLNDEFMNQIHESEMEDEVVLEEEEDIFLEDESDEFIEGSDTEDDQSLNTDLLQ